MTRHPLDHDSNGVPGGSLPASKRGLDALKAEVEALGGQVDRRWGEKRLLAEIERLKGEEPEVAGDTLTVAQEGVIFDGEGGFLPVGAKFVPADDHAREVLIARGFAK